MTDKYVNEIFADFTSQLLQLGYFDDELNLIVNALKGKVVQQQIRKAQLDGERTALENLKTDLVTYPERRVEWHVRNIDDRIEQINQLKEQTND